MASTPGRSRSSSTRTGAVLSTLTLPPAPTPAASADGDDGFAGLGVSGHLLGEPQRLLDQGLHDLRLGHGLDDLTLDEDLALAIAGRDSEICLASLARPVDDAAHDRDAERDRHALQPGLHLLGQGVDVDLRPPAGRAGDD